jgi:hypothetical protein
MGILGLLMIAAARWAGGSRRRPVAFAWGLALLLIALTACGGGGGSYTPGPGGSGGTAGTPKGPGTITITATYKDPQAPAGPVQLVHTMNVPMNVQ